MDPLTADPSAIIKLLTGVKTPSSLALRTMKKPSMLYSEAVSHSSVMALLVILVISNRTRVTAAKTGKVISNTARQTKSNVANSPKLNPCSFIAD